ncbi:MAG: hypothetical protein KDC12_03655 [Flavobacteriales bacterium]|nr:hypothetical protein [Flavobacteriales bacterium]
MIKSIASTVLTRIAVMALTFVVVVLNTNYIGATGQGTVALISLGILLQVAINNFVGGTAVVYLATRVSPGQLMPPALIWTLLSAVLFYFLLPALDVVPTEYVYDVVWLGVIQSLFTFQQQLLLGKRRIHGYNISLMTQMASLLIAVAYGYIALGNRDASAYVDGLYVSFWVTLLVSIFINRRDIQAFSFSDFFAVLGRLLRHGFFGQTSNVIQLLINRMLYVILDQFTGRAQVGLFSVGMQVNEAALAPSKSMATVQFSEISASRKREQSLHITLNMLKVSCYITALALLVLCVIPNGVFQWVFGDEIDGLNGVILRLAPGMFALSVSGILAHHFSGTGRFYVNTLGSVLALVVVLTGGYLYIPEGGITAAAWALSAAFSLQALFLLIMFMVMDKPNAKDLNFKVDLSVFRQHSDQ